MQPGTRMPAFVMTSGRALLAAKTDAEVLALLRRMERKPFTRQTRTSLEALMEAIRKVRETGFAAIKEELEVGLLSLAVPIENRRGETVAALTVSSNTARATLTELCAAALPVMRKIALEVGAILP